MDKKKLFSLLSLMGLLFLIYGGIKISQQMATNDEIIQQAVEIPDDFKRQFSRTKTHRRFEELKYATFLSPEGNRQNWKILGNEYKLVNFWATWCAPCVLELPSLQKLAKRYEGQGLKVVPISFDTRYDHDQIKRFLKNRGISDFAAYFDDNSEVQGSVRIAGIPTSYLLDPQGRVTHIFEGDANWVSPSAIAFFDAVLQKDSIEN